jgi:predicted signal transduction protein with EAL and GGDEF domain
LGGDEFVVLLEDIKHIDEVLVVCNKLADNISKPVLLGQNKVSVNSSIGIAVCPEDADNTTDLLKSADIAMFHAKKQGSDSYQFFHQEMNHKIQKKLQLESDLMLAFEENKFVNYYQPIICGVTKATLGFEVLLRWSHNGKMILPNEFIPAAESTGLIKKMTLATLKRALNDLVKWLEFSSECYLSVNLSAKDFENEMLFDNITQLIKSSKIKPQHLVFEITETVLMSDAKKALKWMQDLKSLGCLLYLDDFGTGYSSLTYLKNFPIDVLKIDRSFVQDIGVEQSNEAIIKSTLALANSLGKECVAEGVETFEQVSFLQMLGCSYMQGFLFSKPVPAEDVITLLNKDWQNKFKP